MPFIDIAGDWKKLCDENAALRERIAGLEAHIKACATTADGVPIRPGMELYFYDGEVIRMIRAHQVFFSSRDLLRKRIFGS